MWARTSFGRRGDREVGTEGDTAETNSRIVAAARSFGLVRSLALQVGSASRMLARNADRHPRRSERLTKNRCEASERGVVDDATQWTWDGRDAVPLSRPDWSVGRGQHRAPASGAPESGDEPAVIAGLALRHTATTRFGALWGIKSARARRSAETLAAAYRQPSVSTSCLRDGLTAGRHRSIPSCCDGTDSSEQCLESYDSGRRTAAAEGLVNVGR